jgi:Holliday junction resolvasome RuvABC endonuclease subunit
MEGYAFGAKFAREILGELGGILKLAVNDYACADLLVVSPNELKKYATGKGNAKKQDVLLGIYKNWEVSFDDDNQADAFALAVLGLHSRNMLHSMFLKKTTQAQLASVAAVAKSSVELGKPPLPVRSRTRLNVGQK